MTNSLQVHFRLFLFLLPAFLQISCNQVTERTQSTLDSKGLKDSVVDFNREIVRKEIQEIDDYMVRHHWNMATTHTGLRYMVYRKGTGIKTRLGNVVGIKYTISLLNGDKVPGSDTTKLFTLELGKRNVISGLEEGLLLMRKGDRAKLIVPSHLAFGLLGDLEEIPGRAVLVYDVELCAIENSRK